MGLGIAVNEGVWAGAISGFALMATLGIAYGYRRHRRVGPVGLAVVGAALVLWAMYGDYSRAVEVTGFAALVVAAFWDWREKRKPSRP
jgi:putative Ca2+/H+ antiporter (TMEM165/GDT1 family)